jgi:hypothetical protein
MTERRATDPFETRFAEQVRAYTDSATERRIDSLAISRAAMASGRASRWSRPWLGGGLSALAGRQPSWPWPSWASSASPS